MFAGAMDPKIIDKEIEFQVKGRIAIITINRVSKLNALTQHHYYRIAERLHEIAKMDNVVVTVITGKGRFFSSGADVTASRESDDPNMSQRRHLLGTFVANNLHNTHAYYAHPKILVTALNGPAVGISAAQTAHSDFIYAAPHAWIATPFSSLGLVAEGGASKAFVDRLGISRAKEALLQSRKIKMPALLSTGFVNYVVEDCGGDPETGKGIDTDKFLQKVLDDIEEKLGPHLVTASLLKIKEQISAPNRLAMDKAGLDEIWGGLDVFLKGVPQKEFQKIANGEKRHKL